MPDMLNIGTSALVAFQRALTTTSHNISNANTEGYSRQRVELATRYPEATGAGFFGTGVDVKSVTRQYDQFLTQQVNYQSSAYNRLDAYHSYATQVDNLLADPQAGLAPTLQEFFNAVQQVANTPTSGAARQNLITSSETLVSRFHAIDQRLTDAQNRVNQQMGTTVNEINQMANQVAELNKQIVAVRGAAGGQPPNDLLDKRDQVIKELSQRVSITTVEQDDGMVNVFIGTGQGIVVGPTVTKLAIAADPALPTRKQIAIGSENGAIITHLMTGGTLGGIIDFQNQVLDPAQRQLGQVAAAVAFTFNDQHRLGIDLNNETGQDFFDPSVYSNVPAYGYATNLPTSAVTLNINSASAVGASDYLIRFTSATTFDVLNTDGSVATDVNGTAITGTIGVDIPQLGFTVNGTAVAGDKFYLRPTGFAARNMDVVLSDPNKVAAALPIASSVHVSNAGSISVGELGVVRDASQPFGTSTGYLSLTATGQADYDDLAALRGSYARSAPPPAVVTPDYGPLSFSYSNAVAPAGGYNIALPAGAPAGMSVQYLGPYPLPNPPPAPVAGQVPYNAATDDGKTVLLRVSDGAGHTVDVKFRLGGAPHAGDTFDLGNNTDGHGDNGNALELAKLQSATTMQGGRANFQTVYAGLVADVGTKTHSADLNKKVADTLYEQAVAARESVAGVNLDEEAANLLKYQQAYMASTKMVTVANTLFQTLLSAVGV